MAAEKASFELRSPGSGFVVQFVYSLAVRERRAKGVEARSVGRSGRRAAISRRNRARRSP